MYSWRYNLAKTYLETLITQIGSSSSVDSSYLESSNDDNCIYVAWAGDDVNAGTSAAPVRTIEAALALIDTAHDIIEIKDSNTYDTDITGVHYLDIAGITVQGAAGQSPALLCDTATQNYVCKLSYSGKLINVRILVDDSGNQITGVEADSGTVKNVTIDGATREGISVPSGASTVLVYNTIVKNSLNRGSTDGNAVKIVAGTVTLSRCLLVDNQRAGVYYSGSTAKSTTIDYCTIAGNQYGVYGYGSTNTSVTVSDSIIYENAIYDYYHTSITCTKSDIGSISGLTTFERVVLNPCFIGGSDYRIRTVENGYNDGSYTSPVIRYSSDGKDLGCYDYTRTTLTSTYDTFLTEVSPTFRWAKRFIDSKLNYTHTLSKRQTYRGYVDYLTVAWEDILKTEYDNLEAMVESEGNIFLSIDNGATYTEYLIDKTQDFGYEKKLNKQDGAAADYVYGVQLGLIAI